MLIVINESKGEEITMNKSIAYLFFSSIFIFALLLTSLNVVAGSKTMPVSTCDQANPNTAPSHPNLSLLEKLDIQNLDASTNIIAKNFIWHYYNPKLPGLQGDYHGIEGYKEFFAKLAEMSSSNLQVNVIDTQVVGDELIIVQTCNRLVHKGDTLEFDVVVVWRIVNGKIAEGWDIPSVYNVRSIQKG